MGKDHFFKECGHTDRKGQQDLSKAGLLFFPRNKWKAEMKAREKEAAAKGRFNSYKEEIIQDEWF